MKNIDLIETGLKLLKTQPGKTTAVSATTLLQRYDTNNSKLTPTSWPPGCRPMVAARNGMCYSCTAKWNRCLMRVNYKPSALN